MPDRTLSASSLSKEDLGTINLAEKIVTAIESAFEDPLAKADFNSTYSKLSRTRDAGAGRAAGKLQRDALCTRGKTDKTPISNRNFRWHPMVIAQDTPPYATTVTSIFVDKRGSHPELGFIVRVGASNQKVLGRDLHLLDQVYCAPTEAWDEVLEELRGFTQLDWSRNRCVIPAMEYSDRDTAIQTFLVLGIAVAIEKYEVSLDLVLKNLSPFISEFGKLSFDLAEYSADLRLCPLCRRGFGQSLKDFRTEDRPDNWQAPWSVSKRAEGDDSSLQVMHVKPLIESEIRHNPHNVRFGHRWCNITMTDHTLGEVLDFFSYVAGKHKI
jgi:hypothetical protein